MQTRKNERSAPKGMVERAIVEAVDAVAAPSVRGRVIALALQWSKRTELPERGSEVGHFVRGELFRALEETLGHESAVAVRDELMPLAALVEDDEISSVRPSWPCPPAVEDDEPELTVGYDDEHDDADLDSFADASLEEAGFDSAGDGVTSAEAELVLESGSKPRRAPHWTDPAPDEDLPTLMIASADPSSVSRLNGALAGIAYVEPVRDALAVLEWVDPARTNIIVLDCRHPSVRAETLLAMQPELPAGARVVLWNETAELERELALLGAGIPSSWIRCGHGAGADDVATVCRVLLP